MMPHEIQPPWLVEGLDRLPVLPGETLAGRYRIERVLGAGGMGIVLCARDLVTRERVAVKMPNPHSARPADLARFETECTILESLDSPLVARFHARGEVGGLPYLVMEYFESRSLAEALAMDGAFGVPRAMDCLRQTCTALSALHRRGIVHRDLKLENLLLVGSGAAESIRLIDFGIAKRAGFALPEGCVGSPRYMAPEQFSNPNELDHRADIWSVGIVAFELLTGDHPFIAYNVRELKNAILHVAAPSLLDIRPDLPAALVRLVDRCLSKDRSLRYPSVEAVIEALAIDVPFALAS
jgi:serine/threonine-protein kinase